MKATRLAVASVIVAMMITTVATASSSAVRTRAKLPTTESSFTAVARRGATQPFVATYKVLDAKRAPYSFIYVTSGSSNPLKSLPPPGDYLYRALANGQEYEFISNNGDYYECLAPASKAHWDCEGPINISDIGYLGMAMIGSYDVEPDYLAFFAPSASPVTKRVVDGFHLACIRFTPRDLPVETWCITSRGVFGYVLGFPAFKRIELMSLSYRVPKDEFALPAKPTRWTSFVAAKLCEFGPPGFANPGTYAC